MSRYMVGFRGLVRSLLFVIVVNLTGLLIINIDNQPDSRIPVFSM